MPSNHPRVGSSCRIGSRHNPRRRAGERAMPPSPDSDGDGSAAGDELPPSVLHFRSTDERTGAHVSQSTGRLGRRTCLATERQPAVAMLLVTAAAAGADDRNLVKSKSTFSPPKNKMLASTNSKYPFCVFCRCSFARHCPGYLRNVFQCTCILYMCLVKQRHHIRVS